MYFIIDKRINKVAKFKVLNLKILLTVQVYFKIKDYILHH